MSSWMVVAPCLTVKPHPDWSLLAELDPSVHVHYEVLQFAVLSESFISVISPTPNLLYLIGSTLFCPLRPTMHTETVISSSSSSLAFLFKILFCF